MAIGWQDAESGADRVREARRSAPAVHAALVHEGMAVLNRRGVVGDVLAVRERYVVVVVGGRARRTWALDSIIEAKAA